MKDNLQQWKTTIMGLITVIVSILVGFGVITPEQVGEVTAGGTGVITGIFAIITGIGGLVLVFKAKDG